MTVRDKQGQSLDGGSAYRLTVPANAPVKKYWSATAYDRATHGLIPNLPCMVQPLLPDPGTLESEAEALGRKAAPRRSLD
jgi:hypothetical protein